MRILIALLVAVSVSGVASAQDTQNLVVTVGNMTRVPIGWHEFCQLPANHEDCRVSPSTPRIVVLRKKAWDDIVRVNKWVNENIRPKTDMAQWGEIERWSYPDTGYGDCEDYVLLKRRMLIRAGWPREALLITVVREHNGDGHAVLTVKTNKGEFILDNQHPDVLLWSVVNYLFVKRQSQSDPNTWVDLIDDRDMVASVPRR